MQVAFNLVVYTPASQMKVDEINPSEIYNKLLYEITGLKGLKPTVRVK